MSILKLKKKFIEKAILESCKIKKQIIELGKGIKLKKKFKFRSYFWTCL